MKESPHGMEQDIGNSYILLYGKNRHLGKIGFFYFIKILHLDLKKHNGLQQKSQTQFRTVLNIALGFQSFLL